MNALNSFSDIFFWILFGEAAYLYLFYKGQSSVKLLLPMEDSGILTFKTLMGLTWGGKVIFPSLKIIYGFT